MNLKNLEERLREAKKKKDETDKAFADAEWEYIDVLNKQAETPCACGCGKKPQIRGSENNAMHSIYHVECECGMTTFWKESIREVVEIWNKAMKR